MPGPNVIPCAAAHIHAATAGSSSDMKLFPKVFLDLKEYDGVIRAFFFTDDIIDMLNLWKNA